MVEERGDAISSVVAGSAVALGWNVGQMTSLLSARAGPEGPGRAAVNGDESSDEDRDQLVMRIRARVLKLADVVSVEELQDATGKALDRFQADMGEDELRHGLDSLRTKLGHVLVAEDSRLGKAYRLGIALQELSSSQPDATQNEPQAWYDEDSVERIERYLAELHTILPDHAAMGVFGSLQIWKAFGKEKKWGEPDMRLDQQGRVWRALLSGEKSATGDLKLADYVYAGRHAVKNAAEISSRVLSSLLSRPSGAAALVVLVALLLVGVVLLVSSALTADGASAAGGGGLTLVSGAGIIGLMKKLWDGIEGVWDAAKPTLLAGALDIAVAAAITKYPWRKSEDELREEVETRLRPTGFTRPSESAVDARR